MHALTKTKVSEASLTNLHNSQLLRKCMLWRLGENIDPGYLQMVILSTLHLSVSLSCFNKVLEKVWKKNA